MGSKSIITAAKDFFHARQRVQEKLGENKTGNTPPTTTPADRRGGPRPGHGREAGTVLHITALAKHRDGPCPGPRQEKADTENLVLATNESAPQARGASLLPTISALLVASPRG